MPDRLKTIYGPYVSRTQIETGGRKFVVAVYESGRQRSISYVKFLVEFLLDRELDRDLETIDHIDQNPDNNAWDNLRIITRSEHCKQDRHRVTLVSLPCVWCKKPTEISPAATRDLHNKGKAGPFCSRKCRGQYGAALQNGKVPKLPVHVAYASEYTAPEKHGGILVSSLEAANEFTEEMILEVVARTQRAAKAEKRKNNASRIACNPNSRLRIKRYRCAECKKPVARGAKYCSQACTHEAQKKIAWPSPEQLTELVWSMSMIKLSKQLGVSDNAIKTHCQRHGVKRPPQGYWARANKKP